jgi:hypothetical protein
MKTYPNGRCCVFQPFDKAEFDKRFDDILFPAIEAAGLEPYRVDRDLGSTIPVDTLHQEIQAATICVADITTRNPNVMYELGYAIAAGKDVVIICGPSKEKYPFDIQHRGIIPYESGAPRDFKALETTLTQKLDALLRLQEKTTNIARSSPVKSSHGLQPHEQTALALIMANSASSQDSVSTNWIKQEMRKSGYTDIGSRLAVTRLVRLGYVQVESENDYDGNPYSVCVLTEQGEDWLLENQSQFVVSTVQSTSPVEYADQGITDEDIPF